MIDGGTLDVGRWRNVKKEDEGEGGGGKGEWRPSLKWVWA